MKWTQRFSFIKHNCIVKFRILTWRSCDIFTHDFGRLFRFLANFCNKIAFWVRNLNNNFSNINVLWCVTSCNLIDIYRRFEITYLLWDICDFNTVGAGRAGFLVCYAECQGCWFQRSVTQRNACLLRRRGVLDPDSEGEGGRFAFQNFSNL